MIMKMHSGQKTCVLGTINVTTITKVWSANKWRPLVTVITTLLCCNYFPSSSVVLHAFSACIRQKLKFEHHPHDFMTQNTTIWIQW